MPNGRPPGKPKSSSISGSTTSAVGTVAPHVGSTIIS